MISLRPVATRACITRQRPARRCSRSLQADVPRGALHEAVGVVVLQHTLAQWRPCWLGDGTARCSSGSPCATLTSVASRALDWFC